jgi:cytochrome b561
VHVLIGILLLTIVVMRLIWRLTHAQRPEPAGPRAVRTLAPLVHWLLYALVLVVLIAGVVTESVRGDSFFGLFKIPAFQADRPLRSQMESLHELLANTLLIVAGAHAAAALIHAWVWRDGVLGRMIPALKTKGRT